MVGITRTTVAPIGISAVRVSESISASDRIGDYEKAAAAGTTLATAFFYLCSVHPEPIFGRRAERGLKPAARVIPKRGRRLDIEGEPLNA